MEFTSANKVPSLMRGRCSLRRPKLKCPSLPLVCSFFPLPPPLPSSHFLFLSLNPSLPPSLSLSSKNYVLQVQCTPLERARKGKGFQRPGTFSALGIQLGTFKEKAVSDGSRRTAAWGVSWSLGHLWGEACMWPLMPDPLAVKPPPFSTFCCHRGGLCKG